MTFEAQYAGSNFVCPHCAQNITLPAVESPVVPPPFITTTQRSSRRSRARKPNWHENPWFVGISVIIAFLAVGCVLLLFRPIEKQLDDAQRDLRTLQQDVSKVTVSKSEYDRIEHGMSYPQVVRVIGSPGEQMSSNQIDGQGVIPDIRTEMYMWQNGNGSNMNAIFQNDKLIQKAQFGLP